MIERLAARVGPRGLALLTFAAIDFVYAYALTHPPVPLTPLYAWPDDVAPLCVWAAMWAAVGVACLVSAFLHHDVVGFVAAVMLKFGWATLLGGGWVGGAIERGYVNVVIWGGFGVAVLVIMAAVPNRRPGVMAAPR